MKIPEITIVKDYFNPDNGESSVVIKCNGKFYSGESKCHEEDKKFQSEKVGKNIAYLRAEIKALQELYHKARVEANIKLLMLRQVNNNKKELDDSIDPTHRFIQNATKAKLRADLIYNMLNSRKEQLRKYLKNQNKLVRLIIRIRKERGKNK